MTVIDSVGESANAFYETLQKYADSHHDGLVALSLFAGVIIAFSGRTLLRPTVFLLGFVPATVTIIALGLAFLNDESPPSSDDSTSTHVSIFEGIVVTVAVVCGVIVGVVMLRLLFRIATFLLCAGFGAVIVFVFHLFLLEPVESPNALFMLYVAAAFAALLAGLFSVSYPDTGIILGTAFDGAALSVFSLSRFLGHRPNFLSETVKGTDISMWWAIGYGTATLLLGVFGAMTQRQVAIADEIITQNAERKRNQNGQQLQESYDPMSTSPYGLPPGENEHLLPYAEPPRTPQYMRSGGGSPATNSAYGAVDHEDSQYSVVRNLGAAPLEPAAEAYQNGKETNGPLPL